MPSRAGLSCRVNARHGTVLGRSWWGCSAGHGAVQKCVTLTYLGVFRRVFGGEVSGGG